jgi:hypothetical protein
LKNFIFFQVLLEFDEKSWRERDWYNVHNPPKASREFKTKWFCNGLLHLTLVRSKLHGYIFHPELALG